MEEDAEWDMGGAFIESWAEQQALSSVDGPVGTSMPVLMGES